MASGYVSVASAGVLAADLLAEACRPGPEVDLRLETVRGLAADLGRRLASLAETADDGTSDSMVEAALGTLIPGAVLLVAKDGKVIHERTYGYAELNDYSMRGLASPRSCVRPRCSTSRP